MMNDTTAPKNKPDYADMSDTEWQEATESTRQTIINDLNDRASVRAYLRFRDVFEGYKKVRKKLLEMVRVFRPNTNESPGALLPDFIGKLKSSIDPLSRVIYRDVDNRIQELKRERRETLERLLQKAVNRSEASEIREDILDEIERLDDVQ
jgi:hypothetical protein